MGYNFPCHTDRLTVEELPPLFAAGIRFFIAGVVLYGFLSFRGKSQPTRVQWRNLAIMGLLMFVAEYGPLFWARRNAYPSGARRLCWRLRSR